MKPPSGASAHGTFRPPFGLGNTHAQSILSSLPLRKRRMARKAAPFLLESLPAVIEAWRGGVEQLQAAQVLVGENTYDMAKRLRESLFWSNFYLLLLFVFEDLIFFVFSVLLFLFLFLFYSLFLE